MRRQREPLLERESIGLALHLFGGGPECAHHPVRFAERHALAHERVGQLDREQVVRERRRDPVAIRCQRVDRRRECCEQQLERVRRVEHGLLVLLQILLVRAREALQQRRQPLRVREQPRALSPRQLEQVRVALLRQQARAGREPVRRREPAERRRAEEHEVFREPGQVDPQQRRRLQVLDGEVAIAHGIERICRHAREAEPGGERGAVVAERRAGHGAGAEREPVGGLARLGEALFIARKSLDVRQPPVREPHRLRRLEVRVRRACEVARVACLRDQRALQLAHALDRRVAQPHDVHAQQRGDLVVA